MSTLSSLVLASSSTLTLDLLQGQYHQGHGRQKGQVFIMRCLIVVFIAISVVLAIVQYKSNVTFIAQLMGVSWGALAGAFLAPFLFGLYWKKTTKAACWACFLFGTIRVCHEPGLQHPPGLSAFPAAAPVPHQLRRLLPWWPGWSSCRWSACLPAKPDKQMVDEAFACYDKKTPVSQKNALSD